MFFFYVDETGNRDVRVDIPQRDGTTKPGDWLYVLTAISLFEHRWHGFEKTINRRKVELIQRIARDTGIRLELADCEIKSSSIRIPKERAKHPFLSRLTDDELAGLVELYYGQLAHHNMHILAVLVDKRHLLDYMDSEKLHRKSWEFLLEQVERLMRARFSKHQAIMVNDDVSRQVNRSLAMKHVYLLDRGTASEMWLRHICEMPMFVKSELSNGVQLADLCSYNIYRAFRYEDLSYSFFGRIKTQIWSRSNPVGKPFCGLWVFPGNSPLRQHVEEFEKQRASTEDGRGSES
jgi:hypothetical protein